MGDRDDPNDQLRLTEDYRERETAEPTYTCSVQVAGTHLRCGCDPFDGSIEFVHKPECGICASPGVPASRGTCLFYGTGVKFNPARVHRHRP